MTWWQKFLLNVKERIMMWKVENMLWTTTAVASVILGWYVFHHIQFVLYGIAGLVFGFAFLYSLHKLFENPVKDEIKIQEAVDARKSMEAGSKPAA